MCVQVCACAGVYVCAGVCACTHVLFHRKETLKSKIEIFIGYIQCILVDNAGKGFPDKGTIRAEANEEPGKSRSSFKDGERTGQLSQEVCRGRGKKGFVSTAENSELYPKIMGKP